MLNVVTWIAVIAALLLSIVVLISVLRNRNK